ncbi:MAG: helix-turn-helix domain-containing protein [Desulfosudaceae bacterium]
MAPNKLSFGLYLARCRQERGLLIEQVAEELKLGVRLLSAMENENIAELPDPVYTRGFLRSYAGLVGADAAWVVSDYQQTLSLLRATSRTEKQIRREQSLFWCRLAGVGGVVLAVMISTILVLSSNGQNSQERSSGSEKAAVAPSVVSEQPRPRPAAVVTDSSTAAAAAEENIRLSVITVEETWLKINIDNEKTKEYTLQPGDQLELQAESGFNLLIGNAAGIRLLANRIPVEVPGDHGEVVNIEIP